MMSYLQDVISFRENLQGRLYIVYEMYTIVSTIIGILAIINVMGWLNDTKFNHRERTENRRRAFIILLVTTVQYYVVLFVIGLVLRIFGGY